MFGKHKKYTCSLCSNVKETGKNKRYFCTDCITIRNWIRLNGLNSILNFINTPSAPKY